MNSTAAIFARLAGAASITQRLAAFDAAPAIFSDAAPDAFVFADLAATIIAAPTADDDASTYTETIRAVTQDVRLYAKHTGSTADLDQLARDVRDLFHLRPSEMSVTGGVVTIATATGPVAAPTTDPSLIGRRVTLRLELQKDS